jgi:E3 ubiquitin-protein ligase MUL1
MSARDRETAEALVRFAASLDGAVLGLGTAALAVVSWVKYLAVARELRLVASATAASIAGVRSILPEDGEPRLVAVRGIVRTIPGGSYLKAPGSGEYGVVTKHTQMCLFTEWRGIFGWTFDLHALLFRSWKEQIITSFRTVKFALADSMHGNRTLMVTVDLDKSYQPLPLSTVYHKLIPVETSPYTLFQTIIGNGYPIALLDEEKILPLGKVLTAIGLCRTNDENVEITSCPEIPFFLSELTKGEMQAELASRSRTLFWASIALGPLSVCLVGHAIYRGLARIKLRREARQAQQLFGEAEDAIQEDDSSDEDEIGDGQLCVVCLRKRRKAAFIPCGHLVCCSKCALRMEREAEPLCPMCRQDIRYMIRIYDS